MSSELSSKNDPNPVKGRAYSAEWLARRLAIADDSNAGAGAPWPSCFVCGQLTAPHDVAVGHLVHTDIVCCTRCKSASETGPAQSIPCWCPYCREPHGVNRQAEDPWKRGQEKASG